MGESTNADDGVKESMMESAAGLAGRPTAWWLMSNGPRGGRCLSAGSPRPGSAGHRFTTDVEREALMASPLREGIKNDTPSTARKHSTPHQGATHGAHTSACGSRPNGRTVGISVPLDGFEGQVIQMVQLTNETIDACLMPKRCRMCEEAELARAEIAAERVMERRAERAFEQRRW